MYIHSAALQSLNRHGHPPVSPCMQLQVAGYQSYSPLYVGTRLEVSSDQQELHALLVVVGTCMLVFLYQTLPCLHPPQPDLAASEDQLQRKMQLLALMEVRKSALVHCIIAGNYIHMSTSMYKFAWSIGMHVRAPCAPGLGGWGGHMVIILTQPKVIHVCGSDELLYESYHSPLFSTTADSIQRTSGVKWYDW